MPDPSLDLPVPQVALAIAAHPDDVELQAGATLAKWAAAGTVVHHLVCTDGSKGTWEVDADTGALVRTREQEQRDAAAALGATGRCVFLRRVDGELDSDLSTRAEVARWIRELKPTVVLGHDPWRRYRLHPDHRHAGFLTVEGIVAARDPHFFPDQGLRPHRPETLLLFEADEVDHVESVAGHLDAKLASLHAHTSQLLSTMGIDREASPEEVERQAVAFDRGIRDRAARWGTLAGVPAGEAYKRMSEL